jgi:lauroyl/myristoyl acyltransferase
LSIAQFLGRALHALAKLPGALPLAWQRALGRGFGRLVLALDLREARIARRNLGVAGRAAEERDALVRAILEATGANLMETCGCGRTGASDNLLLVRDLRGRTSCSRAGAGPRRDRAARRITATGNC